MEAIFAVVAFIVFAALVATARGLRIIQQYERGVVFRLGQIRPEPLGPGLNAVVPIVDRVVKVNMQIVALAVPAQDGITHDNITVRVDAVVYFRVIDPIKATVNVQNYLYAVSQVAQTSLRSVIGRSDLDELLSERERINAILKEELDEPTEGPWGVRIERVEIKDVSLPESMKRSMSRQAEAERERRARIIAADGEFQASKKLAQAAQLMAADPAALQLRLLQTVSEVATEKNSTLVMPFPVELLRFFEGASRRTPEPPPASPPSAGGAPTAVGDGDAGVSALGDGGVSALGDGGGLPEVTAGPDVPAPTQADESISATVAVDDVVVPPPPTP